MLMIFLLVLAKQKVLQRNSKAKVTVSHSVMLKDWQAYCRIG